MNRYILTIFVTFIVSTSLAADVSSTSKDFPGLLNAIVKFQTRREVSNKKFLDSLDKILKMNERNNAISEDEKDAVQAKVESIRRQFIERKELPVDDDFLPLSISYLDSLYDNEALNVKKQFEKYRSEIGDDVSMKLKLDALEAAWFRSLPTGNGFERNGDWYGRRVLTSGHSIDCNFHIRKYENEIVSGSIWWDNRSINQCGVEVKGKYYGNQVVLETGKSLRRGPHIMTLQGYHIGNRIVLQVRGKKGVHYANMSFYLKQ